MSRICGEKGALKAGQTPRNVVSRTSPPVPSASFTTKNNRAMKLFKTALFLAMLALAAARPAETQDDGYEPEPAAGGAGGGSGGIGGGSGGIGGGSGGIGGGSGGIGGGSGGIGGGSGGIGGGSGGIGGGSGGIGGGSGGIGGGSGGIGGGNHGGLGGLGSGGLGGGGIHGGITYPSIPGGYPKNPKEYYDAYQKMIKLCKESCGDYKRCIEIFKSYKPADRPPY
ncbi:ctenidin-3-like [Frankliniella occidentalis]|uniref:Ctenidin-3-like n=1 Tax=Frankliniella occidentalis TaxID=133901 RepID=A0A6J1SET6_FRAOC|nr:ctenidin-3-like [Frankliniella occidentalis]